MNRFAFSAAAAAMAAVSSFGLLATTAFAAVITIERPTPISGVSGSPSGGAVDTRIGAGVPNTGGLVPDASIGTAGPGSTGAPAPLATTTNAQMAVQALETTNAELVAIATLGASSPVRVVLIGTADSSLDALAKTRGAKSEDTKRLQDAIAANASFKSELAAKSVDVTRIVAADVSKDGLLTLYAMA